MKWWIEGFKESPIEWTIGTLIVLYIAIGGTNCIVYEAFEKWSGR